MADELTSGETALRQAVIDARFDEVHHLLNECVDCIERRLDAHTTVEEIRTLADRAHALLEWTGAMLTMARENQAAELARLRSVHCYAVGGYNQGRSSTA